MRAFAAAFFMAQLIAMADAQAGPTLAIPGGSLFRIKNYQGMNARGGYWFLTTSSNALRIGETSDVAHACIFRAVPSVATPGRIRLNINGTNQYFRANFITTTLADTPQYQHWFQAAATG